MDSSNFLQELEMLEKRFDALSPELELTVRDPELGVEGYVVVWTTLAAVGGPLGRLGKGGTRITPSVSLEEIRTLARTMALKNAAAGLPLGGAKSGLRADPTDPLFEKRYRRFVSLVQPVLAERGGLFGGFGFDIGGSPIHALWACDELKSTRSFTGKPVELGGTDYDREGIAGYGVVVAAVATLKFREEDIKQQTVAIQGLGAMGAAIFRYILEEGGSVTWISDPRIGGTFNLTPSLLQKISASVVNLKLEQTEELLKGEKAFPLDDVLYKKVDCLFPAALQGVITKDNVPKLNTRYIFEAANNPCTEEARKLLHESGVTLVPDFIANPGGIIAAFVEMSSTVTPDENIRTRKNVQDAKKLTRERISANVETTLTISSEKNVSPVQAGKYIALKNIFRRNP